MIVQSECLGMNCEKWVLGYEQVMPIQTNAQVWIGNAYTNRLQQVMFILSEISDMNR